jgi:hypothetical protein
MVVVPCTGDCPCGAAKQESAKFGGITMATAAQIEANRANARKSTGPRTPEGKERASRNAVKHGLLAREAVIPGEDPEEFEAYRQWMLAELDPTGPMEEILAGRVVGLSWRLRRAERLQNAAFAALDDGTATPVLEGRLEEWKRLKGNEADRGVCGVVEDDHALGRVVAEDFAQARVLDRLLLYERRIESSLYRTMGELRRLRAEGQAREGAASSGEVSDSQDGLPTGQEPGTATRLASFGANTAPGDETPKTTVERPAPAGGAACGMGTPETPRGVTTSTAAVAPAHHSSIPSFQPSNAVPPVPVGERWCKTKPIGEEFQV